ncbi:MAG: alpha/beta hydrolase [Desulfococcaceae bacterium]
MKLEIIRKYPEQKSAYPPLFFIHGAYAGAWCWDIHFTEYFVKQGFEVHAVSLQGHGESPGKDCLWCYGMEDYLREVRAIVREMDEAPVLIGHSMGGYVVQKCMTDSQTRTAGAVLMASVPPQGMMGPVIRMWWCYPHLCNKLNLINIMPKWTWEKIVSLDELRKLIFSEYTRIDTVKKLLPFIQHESLRAQTDMALTVCICPGKNRKPVLVLGGEEDIIVPPEFVRETAKTYHAEMNIFPKTGHALMVEDRWEAVADFMCKWLKKNYGACESENPVR